MKREIQVHFHNCGQLSWSQDIEDVEEWLLELDPQEAIITCDEDTGRHFYFDMENVTAIIVSNKSNKEDLFVRAYNGDKDAPRQI